MKKEDLLKIIEDDDLGLLDVKKGSSTQITSDDRLVTSFQEIIEFVKKHGHEPKPGGDIHEHKLCARLKGLRDDQEKIKGLKDLDTFGLLKIKTKKIESIDDIFNDDDLGLFDNDTESIFNLKYVKKQSNIADYIATRKPCKEFEKFENKFIQCQKDLASGKRKILPFKDEPQIEKGFFFVLKGVLVYIAEVGEGGRMDARLRCIYENGTESDLLLISLAAELYRDGRRITIHEDHLLDGFFNITEEDEETGFIYILKSLSDKPEIQKLDNLYKIGFSRSAVEERIKNAKNEPSFLMASVSIVSAYKCFNMNPSKLEQLLHTFFGSSCLNLDVYDVNGNRHMPREWFIAPIEIIELAIELVINGDIINYRYDKDKKDIIRKQ